MNAPVIALARHLQREAAELVDEFEVVFSFGSHVLFLPYTTNYTLIFEKYNTKRATNFPLTTI